MYLLLKYLFIGLLLNFGYSLATNTGKVNGRLLSTHASPIKNVSISLASDSLVVRLTRANEKGYFSFDKLPLGNYRILIMPTGYEKYTTGFFNLSITKPSKELGDIVLKPL